MLLKSFPGWEPVFWLWIFQELGPEKAVPQNQFGGKGVSDNITPFNCLCCWCNYCSLSTTFLELLTCFKAAVCNLDKYNFCHNYWNDQHLQWYRIQYMRHGYKSLWIKSLNETFHFPQNNQLEPIESLVAYESLLGSKLPTALISSNFTESNRHLTNTMLPGTSINLSAFFWVNTT